MILVDSGPLIALINRGDASHSHCVKALQQFSLPMITTWPVFIRAMDFLEEQAGWPGQQALWRMVQKGVLKVAESSSHMMARMADLMRRHQDIPMGLAEASLVALAEEKRAERLFTLDGRFEAYSLPPHFKKGFERIP